jgi:hypothetical protein
VFLWRYSIADLSPLSVVGKPLSRNLVSAFVNLVLALSVQPAGVREEKRYGELSESAALVRRRFLFEARKSGGALRFPQ